VLPDSLKVTLREALEFNRQDAISAVGADFSGSADSDMNFG